jgi:hypothetical protein
LGNQGVYVELSEKFSKFVDVLADMSDRAHVRSEKDLLRLYELGNVQGAKD